MSELCKSTVRLLITDVGTSSVCFCVILWFNQAFVRNHEIKNTLTLLLAVCLTLPVIILCPPPKIVAASASGDDQQAASQAGSYVGSAGCRSCHEKFYELWSTSFHGLAMQPYTPEFARIHLVPQKKPITINKVRYRAEVQGAEGFVQESGPAGNKRYKIQHVMGGKNVYYFLTPLERGRLQVLPVAFDVRKKVWFDTTASHIRHFIDRRDQPLDWREWPLTFNTMCYNCHVSQLSTNYDVKTDTYHTTWVEPGINCETCHGPGEEHTRIFREAPAGTTPKDPRTISWKAFTAQQKNDTCAPCHAKMRILTQTFTPGDRYFDHFSLTTFEDPDFYPDGRDLGENYTFTLWRMSPCAQSGQLDCIHCHTSSGRYRFKKPEEANNACLPCHRERVENAAAHTRHPATSEGNKCIACHMPMTEFARMRRSDHSMLPPAPAATIAFKSPNACNLCHKDKDAQWSDGWVRKWRQRDYQAAVLVRGRLIEAARGQDWKLLPEILNYIQSKDRNKVVAVSLIRLLRACPDERKWPALIAVMNDPSPLLRAAAAAGLEFNTTLEARSALLKAAGDEYCLVRIEAAAALSGIATDSLSAEDKQRVEQATREYVTSIQVQPDQWSSHYNMGNYYSSSNNLRAALASYETASKREPRVIPPLVNAALVHARLGENDQAEALLQKAVALEPSSAEVQFNLGLLKAEQGDMAIAKKHLLAALKSDPQMAEAAYNLCVLAGEKNLEEAVRYCRKAHELRPADPKYAYTLAFYLHRKGDTADAILILEDIVRRQPGYADAIFLLGGIYEKDRKPEDAGRIYRKALRDGNFSGQQQQMLKTKLVAIAAQDNTP